MSVRCHNRAFVIYFMKPFADYDDMPIFKNFFYYVSDAGVIYMIISR